MVGLQLDFADTDRTTRAEATGYTRTAQQLLPVHGKDRVGNVYLDHAERIMQRALDLVEHML